MEESTRNEGIDKIPFWLVRKYYDNFGQQETGLEYEDYERAVFERGSMNLIDTMSQRIYSSIYKDQIPKEEFDEKSGYSKWRDELPGPVDNFARKVAEASSWMAGSEVDFTSPFISGAGKLAKEVKEADFGAQKSYQIDSFLGPGGVWDHFTEGYASEAIGGAFELAAPYLPATLTLAYIMGPLRVAGALTTMYAGSIGRDREKEKAKAEDREEHEDIPVDTLLEVLPAAVVVGSLDAVGAGAVLGKFGLNKIIDPNHKIFRTASKVKDGAISGKVVGASSGAVTGFLGESTTEALQSGIEHVAPKLGVTDISGAEVVDDMLLGGFAGGVAGGALGAVTGSFQKSKKKAEEKAEEPPEEKPKEAKEEEKAETPIKPTSPVDEEPASNQNIQVLGESLKNNGIPNDLVDTFLKDKGNKDTLDRIGQIIEKNLAVEEGNAKTDSSTKIGEVLGIASAISQAFNASDATTLSQIESAVLDTFTELESARKIITKEQSEELKGEKPPNIVSGEIIKEVVEQPKTPVEEDVPTPESDSVSGLAIHKETQLPAKEGKKRERLRYLDLPDMANVIVAPKGNKTPFQAILTRMGNGKIKISPLIKDSKKLKDEGVLLEVHPEDPEAPRIYTVQKKDVSPEITSFMDRLILAYNFLMKNPDSEIARRDFIKLQSDWVFDKFPNEVKEKYKDFEIAVEQIKEAEKEAEAEEKAKAKDEEQKEKAKDEIKKEPTTRAVKEEEKSTSVPQTTREDQEREVAKTSEDGKQGEGDRESEQVGTGETVKTESKPAEEPAKEVKVKPEPKEAKPEKKTENQPAKKKKKAKKDQPKVEKEEKPKEKVEAKKEEKRKREPIVSKDTLGRGDDLSTIYGQVEKMFLQGDSRSLQIVADFSDKDLVDQVGWYWEKMKKKGKLTVDNDETLRHLNRVYQEFIAGRELAKDKLVRLGATGTIHGPSLSQMVSLHLNSITLGLFLNKVKDGLEKGKIPDKSIVSEYQNKIDQNMKGFKDVEGGNLQFHNSDWIITSKEFKDKIQSLYSYSKISEKEDALLHIESELQDVEKIGRKSEYLSTEAKKYTDLVDETIQRIVPHNVKVHQYATKKITFHDSHGTLRTGEAEAYWDPRFRIIHFPILAMDKTSQVENGVVVTDVLAHETIHALRELGFFTKSEWNALEKSVKAGRWLSAFEIGRRYFGYPAEKKAEEAIAEAFGYWYLNRKDPDNNLFNKPGVKFTKNEIKLFERIKKLFDALADGILQKDRAGKDEADWIKYSRGKRTMDRTAEDVSRELGGVVDLDSDLIQIVDDISDLPFRVSGLDIQGVYNRKTDKIYLVANRIPAGHAKGVFMHEVGVHYGLPRMLGKKEFVKVIKDLKRSKDRRVLAAYKRVPKDTPPNRKDEEALAYLVENYPEMSIAKRIVAIVRNFLRKLGLVKSYTPDDARFLAIEAARRYRTLTEETVGDEVYAYSEKEKLFNFFDYDFKKPEVKETQFKQHAGIWRSKGSLNIDIADDGHRKLYDRAGKYVVQIPFADLPADYVVRVMVKTISGRESFTNIRIVANSSFREEQFHIGIPIEQSVPASRVEKLSNPNDFMQNDATLLGAAALEQQSEIDRVAKIREMDEKNLASELEEQDKLERNDVVFEGNNNGQTKWVVPKGVASEMEFFMPSKIDAEMALAQIDTSVELTKRGHDFYSFLASETGMPLEKVSEVFTARQIVALTQSIIAHQKGNGFILGDQTGSGKGRVIAGMAMYSLNKGIRPVFITKDWKLYRDMLRDFNDIGMAKHAKRLSNTELLDDIKILATDETSPVDVNKDGFKIERMDKGGKKARSYADYDMIFTTYNQLQPIAGKHRKSRHNLLRNIAADSMLLLDESHRAGGSSVSIDKVSVSTFLREIMGEAHIKQNKGEANGGVLYASATFAKTPDTISLYLSTHIGKMLLNKEVTVDELNKVIKAGGYALTEVITKDLAKRGEYSRVELDMSDVNFEFEGVQVSHQTYNKVSGFFKELFDFSNSIEDARGTLMASLGADEHGIIEDYKGKGQARINFVRFQNVMHNLRQQVLLSLKTKAMIASTKDIISKGHKPVVAVENTNEALLKYMVDEGKASINEPLNINFADLFLKYLERSTSYSITIKKGTMTEEIDSGNLNVGGSKEYRAAEKHIKESDVLTSGELPISPIDEFITELSKEHKVGEITGRGMYVDYSSGGPILKNRGRVSSNDVIDSFNNGGTDVLIINQAGSTGISLHSSKAYKDRRKRVMLIVQPLRDINDFTQITGRINRLGQEIKPEYRLLVANIPPEVREQAFLKNKLTSLSSHVTGSATNLLSDRNTINIFSLIGNKSVREYMLHTSEGKQLNALLGWPVKSETENAIAKVLNRTILLGESKVEDSVMDIIKNVIDSAITENQVSGFVGEEGITDLGHNGATVLSQRSIDGKTYIREWMMDKLRKPVLEEQAYRKVLESLGLETDISNIDWSEVAGKGKEIVLDRVRSVYHASASDNEKKNRINTQVYSWMRQNINAVWQPGRTVKIMFKNGIINNGLITNLKQRESSDNKMRPSSWQLHILIPSTGHNITKTLSSISILDSNQGASELAQGQIGMYRLAPSIKDVFLRNSQIESQEQVEIIHGDLISALVDTKGVGEIVSFTDKDRNSQIGLRLPTTVSYEDIKRSMGIRVRDAKQLIDFVKGHKDEVVHPKISNSVNLMFHMKQASIRIRVSERNQQLINALSDIVTPEEEHDGKYLNFLDFKDEATEERAIGYVMQAHRVTLPSFLYDAWVDFTKAHDDLAYSVTFKDPEAERQYQMAKDGMMNDSQMIRMISTTWHKVKSRLTRHYQYMDPKDPRYVNVTEKLLQRENASIGAHERTANNLKRIMFGLSSDQQDLLNRYFLLKDLHWTAGMMKEVPFGFTIEGIEREMEHISPMVESNPVLQERVEIRNSISEELRKEMIENGVMSSEQLKNTNYYRHQVLEYYKLRNKSISSLGGSSKIRRMKQWARRGSEKLINTNYYEAEAEWMVRAYEDIATAKLLNYIKSSSLNKLKVFREKAKTNNKMHFVEKLVLESKRALALRTDVFEYGDEHYEHIIERLDKMKDPRTLSNLMNLLSKVKSDKKVPRGTLPLLQGYMRYNAIIAKSLDSIANELKGVDLSSIPVEYRQAMLEMQRGTAGAKAQDASQSNNVFGFLGWLASQKDMGSLQTLSQIIFRNIAKREVYVKNTIGKAYINPRNHAGLIKHFGQDNEVLWQPDSYDGKSRKMHFFTAKTISNHVYERIQDDIMPYLEEQTKVDKSVFEYVVNNMKDSLVRGGPMEEYIINKDLADTLNEFHDRQPDIALEEIALKGTIAIKKVYLFAPWRFIKYIINNLSGDIDAIIQNRQTKPIFSRLPMAFKEVKKVMFGSEHMSEIYQEALEKGIFHSNLTVSDLYNPFNYQINQFSDFDIMRKDPNFYKAILKSPTKYVRFVQKLSIFRENVFRLATYMAYRDQITDGKGLIDIGYGASDPKVLKQISDPLDLAARLARDTLGDYTNISHSGKTMARFYILFYRWLETNARRQTNYLANIYRYPRDLYRAELELGGSRGTAAAKAFSKAALMSALMSVKYVFFYTIIQLWRNLFFDEDEMELPEERLRLHVPIGYTDDGQLRTIRIQGALSDFMGWFGFEDVGATMHEVYYGRSSVKDVAKAVAKAPANRILNAINPFFKITAEFTTDSIWYPDVFNARPMREEWYIHIPSSFGVGAEARKIARDVFDNPMPQKEYKDRFAKTVFYDRTPDEMSWQNSMNMVYSFNDYLGKGSTFYGGTEKGTLMRKVFDARRYGDEKSEEMALEQLYEIGTTKKDVFNSMYRRGLFGALKYRLNQRERWDFYKTLSPSTVEVIKRGLTYEAKAIYNGVLPTKYRQMIVELQRGSKRYAN